jgi:hypothetical protein
MPKYVKSSSRGSEKNELWTDLLRDVESAFPDAKHTPDLWEFALGKQVDARKFVEAGHRYLKQIYLDQHHEIVILKCAQVGLTIYGILRSIHSAYYRGMNVGCFFPTLMDVGVFSKSRFTPMLDENEDLKVMVGDTDATNIKAVGQRFISFDGLRKRIISKPLDLIYMDEIDQAQEPDKMFAQARQRLAHSAFKESLILSNPSLSDFSIQKLYNDSDQHVWLTRCPHCNQLTDLMEEFPKHIVETKDGVIRACGHCHEEVDPDHGEWIAKRPDIKDRRGYWISQVNCNYVDIAELLHDFRTTTQLGEFYNLRLGQGYTDASHRLTAEEVLALCGGYDMVNSDKGPCFCGVDVGNVLHTTVGRYLDGSLRIIFAGKLQDFSALHDVIESFHVAKCVIDGMPDIHASRSFADAHPGRVFLNFYSQHQKKDVVWDERNRTVSSNRIEVLDKASMMIRARSISLPRESDIMREFALHLSNAAKRLITEDDGSRSYEFVRLGPDHYLHSFGYLCLALGNLARSYFRDLL